jgi:hypothetical protein
MGSKLAKCKPNRQNDLHLSAMCEKFFKKKGEASGNNRNLKKNSGLRV